MSIGLRNRYSVGRIIKSEGMKAPEKCCKKTKHLKRYLPKKVAEVIEEKNSIRMLLLWL